MTLLNVPLLSILFFTVTCHSLNIQSAPGFVFLLNIHISATKRAKMAKKTMLKKWGKRLEDLLILAREGREEREGCQQTQGQFDEEAEEEEDGEREREAIIPMYPAFIVVSRRPRGVLPPPHRSARSSLLTPRCTTQTQSEPR